MEKKILQNEIAKCNLNLCNDKVGMDFISHIIATYNVYKSMLLEEIMAVSYHKVGKIPSFDDLVKTLKITCPACLGEGEINICKDCDGDCYNGPNRLCEYANQDNEHYEECATCKGTGEVPSKTERRKKYYTLESIISEDDFRMTRKRDLHSIVRNIISEE